MAESFSPGLFSNFILSMLLNKITVPTDYHSQVSAVKNMLRDDFTGLIDSLTDFAVESANVEFSIETGNENFTSKLNYWLQNINGDFGGQIPRGIDSIAKEYFKERWKSSSFPVLKILKWDNMQGLIVPSQICIVDGESIYSKEIDNKVKKQLLSYEYYLGKDCEASEKLEKGVIITKPFCRLYDEYPTPFLVKRGIYHNYQIIKSIKEKQTKILDEIIPYMFLIKKGTDGLATSDNSPKKSYSQDELDEVVAQFQEMMDEMKATNAKEKLVSSPVRATMYDEQLEHLIPDMTVIFKKELFETTERNILSGLGFIDVIEATSSSRKESVLNPKIFIQDVKSGVKDFKTQIVKELVYKIIEKNQNRRKYVNNNVVVVSSPVTGFMTDKFKTLMKQLYAYGKVSAQTAVEVVGEVDFQTEVLRIESERKQNLQEKTPPPPLQFSDIINEDEQPDEDPSKKTPPQYDKNGNIIPDDKIEENRKKEYNMSVADLTEAVYKTIKALPEKVKKLTKPEQRKWKKLWNAVYKYALGRYKGDKKKAETYASKVAWKSLKTTKKK